MPLGDFGVRVEQDDTGGRGGVRQRRMCGSPGQARRAGDRDRRGAVDALVQQLALAADDGHRDTVATQSAGQALGSGEAGVGRIEVIGVALRAAGSAP